MFGALAASHVAYAQESLRPNEAPLVLIVPTRGNASWLAAERRLDAELRGLQLRVAYDQVVSTFDSTLPERARVAQALVAIQVLREADLGILRFWFTQQPGRRGGYQHLEINLRNADVVSSAVLPVVEAIFDRVEASSGERPALRIASQANADLPSDDAAEDECAKNNALRCAPMLTGRALVGPYLASAASGVALATGVGLRWRPWSALTLEGDVDYQPPLSRSAAPTRLTNQTAAALHVLYEFRNRVGRGVAIGPGVGVFGASRQGQYSFVPRASLRTELLVPLSPRLDWAVVATGATAFGLPVDTPHGGFFASVLMALDVHLN